MSDLPHTDLRNCPHCAFKAPTMIPIYGCPCSCHQTSSPQTEPKNASKGVSRCPDDTTEVDKPIIPQTEQKIDRGQWTGYPKIIVGGIDWQILDILKRNHSPKDCPHEGNCLNDRNALEAIKAILTASNREAQLQLLDRLEARMDACKDCPKDEPPTIHLLAERAELRKLGGSV